MEAIKEDWVECEAELLGDLIRGINYKKTQSSDVEKKNFLPILRANNINENYLNFKNLKYVHKELIKEDQKILIGDIVFAMSSGSKHLVGKSAQAKDNYNGSFGAFCSVFRANQKINSKFIQSYFHSATFREIISKSAKGSNINNLKREHILNAIIPLPPIHIQKAIVKKIEALLSDLDQGITDLKKAQEQLKVYRQAVLKKAFEGELTKEWREKQTNLPSADELLEQIKEERQKHYETQVVNWRLAVKVWEKSDKKGKKPSRISKPKEFPKVKSEEIENYDSIPNSWYWTRFGTVTYKIGDIDHKMPKTVEKGMPYVSTGNIGKDNKIDFYNAKQISRVDFDRLALKIKPEKGDIIFPRYGTIGRNILIDYDKEFLVSYSCAIIKNITKIMDEKFVLYYSLSPIIKKEINRYVVETTQANIGIASIESFVFPLCSKQEQHQIVKEIESRLSVCDAVEQNITESLEKAKALRQSILKKAFEGKLLSEEEIAQCKAQPDYEPASVLLERIKKEKKK